MRDQQLAGLRRLFKPGAAQTLAVAGQDAAPIALNLARALAADGARVLLVDREVGAVAHHAGLCTRYDLAQALDGDRPPRDVLCDGPDGITVLPAARAFARFGGDDWRASVGAVAARAGAFDHWIVHGGPLPGVDTLCALAPTAESVTACYAALKGLARSRDARGTASIVAHGARSEQAARDAYRSVAATARRFLAVDVALEAFVPGAPWPSAQLAPWASFAETAAGRAFAGLAHRRAAPAAAQAAQQG
jgi:hypothetical protein